MQAVYGSFFNACYSRHEKITLRVILAIAIIRSR